MNTLVLTDLEYNEDLDTAALNSVIGGKSSGIIKQIKRTKPRKYINRQQSNFNGISLQSFTKLNTSTTTRRFNLNSDVRNFLYNG